MAEGCVPSRGMAVRIAPELLRTDTVTHAHRPQAIEKNIPLKLYREINMIQITMLSVIRAANLQITVQLDRI